MNSIRAKFGWKGFKFSPRKILPGTLFTQIEPLGGFVPPPGTNYLIADNGDNLITDNGDFYIVDE